MPKTLQRGTVELPLTPEVKAVIVQSRSRWRWTMAVLMAGTLVLAPFLGGISGGVSGLKVTAVACAIADAICVRIWLLPDNESGLAKAVRYQAAALIAGAAFTVIGIISALIIRLVSDHFGVGGVVFAIGIAISLPMLGLSDELHRMRDICKGVYYRSAGPVVEENSGDDGSGFFVGDVHITVGDHSGVARALRNVPWAVIDYTPGRRLILEVRNRAGDTVHVRRGYCRPATKLP